MARQQFALYSEPHVAEIGDSIELKFLPEIAGDDFLDAYGALQAAQRALPKAPEDLAETDLEVLKGASAALRSFLAGLMLPESAAEFERLRLPERVVGELFRWAVELYGARPTGSSTVSTPASPRAGTSGTANSRSKGSTRARGR